jgi:hypothetical protein
MSGVLIFGQLSGDEQAMIFWDLYTPNLDCDLIATFF